MSDDLRNLQRLGRLHGIQPLYYDVRGERCFASAEALLRTLQELGVPIDRSEQAPEAIDRRRRELWERLCEPVVVAWEDEHTEASLRVEETELGETFHATVELEDGTQRRWEGRLDELPVRRRRELDGRRFVRLALALPGDLPRGYHRLRVQIGERSGEALVIAAPERAHGLPGDRSRAWGLFIPLYAFHRERSWGAGDFSDLEALMQWTAGRGGSMVATLPLLASLWDLSDDPSPYAPVSRLFWNELYLDLTRIEELRRSDEARQLLESDEVQQELTALREQRLLDYQKLVGLKRRILMPMAEQFFAEAGGEHREAFDRFCETRPDVVAYAQFRAVGEKQGVPWREWPQRLRDGVIEAGDYDEPIYQYHLYVQWQVERQLEHLRQRADAHGLLWYLDLPLGVRSDGYDVWAEPDIFALNVCGGAPPDDFFTKGQNWGFPPLHPEHIRQRGYSYFVRVLRRHLQYARILRIDHVMGLHRLFWIPNRMEATEGVYVRYQTEELFAVVSLESHRTGACIIGENLGTVPGAVDRAMERHAVPGMYAMQYELKPHRRDLWRPVTPGSAASLNTHDMPPFKAFWKGLEIEDRVDLGLLSREEAEHEKHDRERLRDAVAGHLVELGLLDHHTHQTEPVLEAVLAQLSRSDAGIVLVNAEDLWGETEPQNTPGTFIERPNWRKRARYPFEQWKEMEAVQRILRTVDQGRREAERRAAGMEPHRQAGS